MSRSVHRSMADALEYSTSDLLLNSIIVITASIEEEFKDEEISK